MRRLRPPPLLVGVLAVVLGAVAAGRTASPMASAAPTVRHRPVGGPGTAAGPTPPPPAGAALGDDRRPELAADHGRARRRSCRTRVAEPARSERRHQRDPSPVPTRRRSPGGDAAARSPTLRPPRPSRLPVTTSSTPTPSLPRRHRSADRLSGAWGPCGTPTTGGTAGTAARRHVGTDIIGVRMQPLLAAVDGTVARVRYENVGTAGGVITSPAPTAGTTTTSTSTTTPPAPTTAPPVRSGRSAATGRRQPGAGRPGDRLHGR